MSVDPVERPVDVTNEMILQLSTEILAKRIDPINWPKVQDEAYFQAQSEYAAAKKGEV